MSAAALPFTPETMLKSIPSARIVSIAPIPFTCRMQVTHGFREYKIEAAERGSWTYLDIPAEMVKIADFHDDRRVSDKGMYEDPRQRAQKIAGMWAYPGFGDKLFGRFGVRVLPPGETEPSPELLAEMTLEQETLANSFLTDAKDKEESGQARQITDKVHRPMARWLLGNGAEELSWYGKRDFSKQKECPKCMKKIDARATGCDNCGQDLIEWHQKYNPDGEGDPVIAQILQRLKPKPTPPPSPSAAPIKPPMPLQPNTVQSKA